MCLTIPKKVIAIEKDVVVTEDFQGNRQELKTLIELSVGDFVCSQQNVVIDKMSSEEAQEILQLVLNIKNTEGGEKK